MEHQVLEFHSGSSNAVNTANAVKESLDLALKDAPADQARLIMVHSTMGHNFAQLLKAVHEHCPKAEIVGCTGSGVISSEGVSEKMRALALMVVTGDECAVASVSGIGNENSGELARSCAQSLADKLPGINMVYVLGPGLNVCGDCIIDGADAVFGPDIPLLGALAGDNAKLKRTLVFAGESALEDGLVMVGFADPALEVVQISHHGSLPNEGKMYEVTQSEGNRVDELDGKPAWPALLEKLGLDADMPPGKAIPFTGMGIKLSESESQAYDNEYMLTAPFTLSDDGQSFYVLHKCPVGTRLVPVYRDEDHIFNGVDRMMQRLQDKLASRRPLAVFQADCMARGRMTHDACSKDEIIASIQNPVFGDDGSVPWLGIYGFAEYAMLAGRNRFHHYTTSLSAIVPKV
jgi:hypothetical protein